MLSYTAFHVLNLEANIEPMTFLEERSIERAFNLSLMSFRIERRGLVSDITSFDLCFVFAS